MTMTLSIQNIRKVYPGVTALADVTFEAHGGRVLGLIGVNGAGKSTLMNILGGVTTPTSGEIRINGEVVHLDSPQRAEECQIGFIHQEPVMFRHMTVAENISISKLKGVVNYKKMRETAVTYLSMMGCTIDPDAVVANLPIGECQMVEIARALSSGGKILLFDEPTASFTYEEKEKLFGIIRSLKANGAIIFFISHFLDELEEISDDIVVLRDGKVVVNGKTSETGRLTILQNMIGGELATSEACEVCRSAEVNLQVKGVSAESGLSDINFELRKGEIVGLWGLMGSGRTELMRVLYGLDKAEAGSVHIRGETGELRPVPFAKTKNFCGYVTESRHHDGVFLPWSIQDNITAPNLAGFKYRGLPFLDSSAQKKASERFARKLGVKAPNVNVRVEQLSGGNQQKVIMAKWLMRAPIVFLLDEPTRGVDVGAKAEIHTMIKELAREEGTSVLVVSSEIEEISELSDRVLVLNRGRIVAEVEKKDISKETLMAHCV